MAHDDRELIPRSAIRDSSERGLYLVIGAIAVIVLAGLYVAIGTPGLRTQIARAPVATEAGR
jgi:hypothetical protein